MSDRGLAELKERRLHLNGQIFQKELNCAMEKASWVLTFVHSSRKLVTHSVHPAPERFNPIRRRFLDRS